MSPTRILPALALLLALASPATAAPPAPAPPRARILDISRWLDVSDLEVAVTNQGSFGYDLFSGTGGVIYPATSGKTALFAGGLWIGAAVSGQTRVTVAEYAMEYLPGPILPGGAPDDPQDPDHVVYKVVRYTGDPQDTAHVERAAGDPHRDPLLHHSWSEYMRGAVPYGAPWRVHRLPNTATPDPADSIDVPGPDVLGDQMLWAVYNDADAAAHIVDSGGTTPLGVEVRQTIYGFGSGSPGLSRFAFLRFEIENKGTSLLEDTYVGLWSDPDLGGATDDLVASLPDCDLGYAYNATDSDVVYGTSPPAIGFQMLETPLVLGSPLGMTAFTRYISGTDPQSAEQTYLYLQGRNVDGTPQVDPTTNLPTTYFGTGDPVLGTGWLDVNPADRRMMLSSGPFDLAPGETQVVLAVLAIGQGTSRLASIQQLQHALAQAFAVCDAPPAVTNCPQPASYWGARCQLWPQPSPLDLGAIAACVGERSLYFDWDAGTEVSSFCATAPWPSGASPRVRAEGEYAAFLANYCAQGATAGDTPPIRFLPGTSISCPGLAAQTIGDLAETAPAAKQLISVSYLNDNMLNRRALEGVPWSSNPAWFAGGAGFAYEFLGSGLDPAVSPDSFARVEIRFTAPGEGQKAYRYLRDELADGNAPPAGRVYHYAGYVDVPFQVWDLDRGVQIDAAFFERQIVDASGIPLPPAQQPATLDGTWGPDASVPYGGREYVYVFRTAYDGIADFSYQVDAAFLNAPAMYGLWSKLRLEGDVIDPGDRVLFDYGVPPSPGVDAYLLALAGQPQDNPEVIAAYENLATCLAAINEGTSLEPDCEGTVPTLPSLYDARVEDGRALVRWYTSDGGGIEATAYRRAETKAWSSIAALISDDTGFFTLADPLPAGGGHIGYRLGIRDDSGEHFYGEVWIEAPVLAGIALGAVATPTRGDLVVPVTVGRGPARLDLLDVRGRRVVTRWIDRADAGSEPVRLSEAAALAPGVYVVRLTQAGLTVQAKVVVVR